MTAPKDYSHLQHMFGAYFHQDWDLEGDDWADLVRNYLRDASSQDAMATAVELGKLLNEGGSEEQLEVSIGGLDCCYAPHAEADGPGFRTFLGLILDQIRRVLAA